MTYNPKIHHRQSTRLSGWDYATTGAYFVTICTYQRECILDDRIVEAVLTRAWRLTVNRGKPVEPGDFVVMPNHVHGIVWLAEGIALKDVVRSFKSLCTRSLNRMRGSMGMPLWQRNYHDRIVRDDRQLQSVRQYILDNPAKWTEDPNRPSGHRRTVGVDRPLGAQRGALGSASVHLSPTLKCPRSHGAAAPLRNADRH